MSRIRADKFVNNAANGAPQLTYGVEVIAGVGLTGAGGINITGIATAASFSGNVTGNISGGTVAGSTGTFTGDVDIADKIIHTGDTNTAIRFPAADTFTVETAGSERLRVNSSGFVGVNTDSPGRQLTVSGGSAEGVIQITNNTSGAAAGNGFELLHFTSGETQLLNRENGAMRFDTNGIERLRIDSSGRLVIGSSGRTAGDVNAQLQVEGTSFATSSLNLISNAGASAGNVSHITLAKSRGSADGSNTIVASGDNLGNIQFAGADGTDINSTAALISAAVDGTPGANDMPGRLMFHTTADGASSPTERLRITSGGEVQIINSNLKFSTDGTGINFGASAGSGSASTVLDDYEEGTWTPTANNNFNTITNAVGRYVKVGDIVFLTFQFNFSSLDSASGSSAIVGLPYSPANTNPNTGIEATGICYGNSLQLQIYIQDSPNLSFETNAPLQGSTNTSANFYRGSITYRT